MIKPKHVFLENVITKEECDKLNTLFVKHVKDGWQYRDVIGSCMSNPFRYFHLNENAIVYRLTQCIQKNFPEKVKYSHSFIRMYENNSILNLHTDRKGLDITLTVNIGGLENWPIHISNIYSDQTMDAYADRSFVQHDYLKQAVRDSEKSDFDREKFKEDYSTFLTPKGCGVACYSGNFPHWRDRLICAPDEYVLQIFYHWTFI
jgi:hypothetical protein